MLACRAHECRSLSCNMLAYKGFRMCSTCTFEHTEQAKRAFVKAGSCKIEACFGRSYVLLQPGLCE